QTPTLALARGSTAWDRALPAGPAVEASLYLSSARGRPPSRSQIVQRSGSNPRRRPRHAFRKGSSRRSPLRFSAAMVGRAPWGIVIAGASALASACAASTSTLDSSSADARSNDTREAGSTPDPGIAGDAEGGRVADAGADEMPTDGRPDGGKDAASNADAG